jgi:TRAP-type mannitol/chloroaromatic compound transport system permease small subunit
MMWGYRFSGASTLRVLLKPAHIRALLRLSHAIDRVTDWIAQSTTWIVVLTIAIGFYNVVARYVGRSIGMQLSSNAWIEVQWYLFSLSFFFGFAYILRHGENVRVDFLYSKWSDRSQALVDFCGTVFFLIPFCILGIWVTINPILQSWGMLPDGTWGTWEISPDADGLPRAPIKTMIIVAFVTLLAQAISQAIKYMAIYNGYTEVKQELQADTEQLPLE